MRNTVDVTGGKPIAVLLQSISGVSAINPLVAFYVIHGGKREVLFFYIVRTPHETSLLNQIINFYFILLLILYSFSTSKEGLSTLLRIHSEMERYSPKSTWKIDVTGYKPIAAIAVLISTLNFTFLLRKLKSNNPSTYLQNPFSSFRDLSIHRDGPRKATLLYTML
jgi:hypothetical protein